MASKNVTQETAHGATRRSFLAAIGAAGALPLFPALAQQAATGPGRWTETAGSHLAALRTVYLGEIARLATSLRPRFESGELRGWKEGDDGRIEGANGWGDDAYRHDSPHWVLDCIVAAHFGIELTRRDKGQWEITEGDEDTAHLILAASPHAGATGGDGDVHPCDHATESATWDVIAYARAAGWYTPARDEVEDPLISKAECPDCGHMAFMHTDEPFKKAGCGHDHQGDGCACTRKHTPHVAGVLS